MIGALDFAVETAANIAPIGRKPGAALEVLLPTLGKAKQPIARTQASNAKPLQACFAESVRGRAHACADGNLLRRLCGIVRAFEDRLSDAVALERALRSDVHADLARSA